jgi:hypothetical protein
MNSVRAYAAAVQLKDGKLLVTGGTNLFGNSVNSAEILTEDGWESNIPSLPVTISFHCMVTVNSTTVMVIGGHQNDHNLGKTFYFTIGEESWTEGPELRNNIRMYHSCGKIRRDKDSQEMSIIVAGGNDNSYSLSVEILNKGSDEWQRGPKLPFGIEQAQMVEDQKGGVVLIGGWSSKNGELDTLYQLPHGGQDAVWTEMEQKLKTRRSTHTAFLDCS